MLPDALLESVVEHLQSAWINLGPHTHHDRYEREWPMGSPQYHLQAAEKAATALFQVLRVPLNVYAMYQERVGANSDH